MNIIDVLAILPYYLDLFMSAGGDKIQEQKRKLCIVIMIRKLCKSGDEPKLPSDMDFEGSGGGGEMVEKGEEEEEEGGFADIQRLMRVFSILKILRVIKIARHSTGIQAIMISSEFSQCHVSLVENILMLRRQ